MTENALTVGQLKIILARFDDDLVIASTCCASRDCVHVLEAGTLAFGASKWNPEGLTFNLDPSVRRTDRGDMLAFHIDEDYTSLTYGEDYD